MNRFEMGQLVTITPPNGPEFPGMYLGPWPIRQSRHQVYIPETGRIWCGDLKFLTARKAA